MQIGVKFQLKFPSASHRLLNLNQEHLFKKFLWSNPYKVKIMRSSLMEMLELRNFGHVTTSTIQFDSRYKILLVTSWTEVMTP